MKTRSFLDEIITSSNKVFKDFVSNVAVEIKMRGIPTRETAQHDDTAKQTTGS